MLALNYNTTSGILVRGIQSGTEFFLPPFYCGVPTDIAVQALLPTGNHGAPFTQQTITSGTVTLSLVTTTGYTTIVTVALTISGNTGTATLNIPATGALPAGTLVGNCRLVADLLIGSDTPHIESGCILRVPAFALPDGITYDNFVGPAGPAGAGVSAGGTTGQILGKIDATDFNTQWLSTLDITAIKFGGSTSSQPMLKASGATLQARLADDSGDAAFSAQKVVLGNNSVVLITSDGALEVQNNSGGAAAITASSFNGVTLGISGGTNNGTLQIPGNGTVIGIIGNDGAVLNFGTGGTLGTYAYANIETPMRLDAYPSSEQSLTDGEVNTLTLDHVAEDTTGGAFASNTFTPPAGKTFLIIARAQGVGTAYYYWLFALCKNGNFVHVVYAQGVSNGVSTQVIVAYVTGNGSDEYTLQAEPQGGFSGSTNSGPIWTRFQAIEIITP